MGNSLGSHNFGTYRHRSNNSGVAEPAEESKTGKFRNRGNRNSTTPGESSSGALFLLYLIHRTWSVVVEHVDSRSRRSRSPANTSTEENPPRDGDGLSTPWDTEDFAESSLFSHDMDDSLYGSQYSFCSCSYCAERTARRSSECYSDFLFRSGGLMAPSASPLGASRRVPRTPRSGDTWPPDDAFIKENQRPPVYNPEDYSHSLRQWGRRPSSGAPPLYDMANPTPESRLEPPRSNTLPAKHKDYRSPITTPPPAESEMSLRQFGSVSELLAKLRSDLRAAYSSFVQEFVGSPLEGITLLLEVLRAVQLSHNVPYTVGNNGPGQVSTMPVHSTRISPAIQRRAFLDELACLQCLSLCCARSRDAGSRLSAAPLGLLPLAVSATGPTVKARLLALQLLTTACESETASRAHGAVSEALSTLRLQCGEPVRFRLLVGMIQSGGGSGELQAIGIKFINTFLETADSAQQRLYLQAELQQAGFEPEIISKNLTSNSWGERLRTELTRWEKGYIDVVELMDRARGAEREGAALRSRINMLDRRVQILQEEKGILISRERTLKERFNDLKRGMQIKDIPVPTPRTTSHKMDSSGHEDEGISSSEADRSLSPEVIKPKSNNKNEPKIENIYKYTEKVTINNSKNISKLPEIVQTHFKKSVKSQSEEDETTIEEVIEELHNIVNDAEMNPSWGTNSFENRSTHYVGDSTSNLWTAEGRISKQSLKDMSCSEIEVINENLEIQIHNEDDIIPTRLLPQPPRKSKTLSHIFVSESEQFCYNKNKDLFFDEDALGYSSEEGSDSLLSASKCLTQIPRVSNNEPKRRSIYENKSSEHFSEIDSCEPRTLCARRLSKTEQDMGTNRALLNVIMDARQASDIRKPTKKIIRTESIERKLCIIDDKNKLNGIFLVDINTYDNKNDDMILGSQLQNVYQRNKHFNDVLEARKRTKSLDRIDDGLDSMVDIVVTSENSTHYYKDSKGKSKLIRSPSNVRQMFLPQQSNVCTVRPTVNTKQNGGFLYQRQNQNAGLYSGNLVGNVKSGKLSDLPSGLY